MKGIDVSKHQGKIDWQKVKAALVQQNGESSARGVTCSRQPEPDAGQNGRGGLAARTPGFAIIRAGYGMYENQIDPYFQANMEGAKAAGIPVGVYWYSYAENAAQAKQEAAVCLKIIEPYRSQIVLPVFFDQEYEPGIEAQSKAVRTQMCKTFLEAVQAAGYRPGLYCSLNWYMEMIDRGKLAAYPVWIAQYASKCGYTSGNLIAWQYTSKGRVDGISGNVDLDEGYDGLLQSAAQNGWVYDGPDVYLYEDGQPVKNAWRKDGGWWYRLGPDGKMLTGLIEVDGKGYYLNQSRGTVGGVYVPEGACVITNSSGAIV